MLTQDMSQIKYTNHIQSGCANKQHQQEQVGTLKDSSSFNSSRPTPQSKPPSRQLDIRCSVNHHHHHHLQKHKFSFIVGWLVLLHLLQRLASFHYHYHYHYHLNHHHDQLEIHVPPSSNFKSCFLFANADNSFSTDTDRDPVEIRFRETRRIDNLLRSSSSSSSFPANGDRGREQEQPLDFIKFVSRQDDQSRVGGSGSQQHHSQQHSHYNRNHLNHSPRQRHKHRYSSSSSSSSNPSQTWRVDSSKRGEHDTKQHQTRERSKRHNSVPSFYDGGSADRPIVATKKGLVKGITQRIFTGKFVDAFLGIPFAQPPVGKYRFRHPQPVNPWPGELDASRLSNSCYQVNDTFFGATFGGTSIWNANTPLDEDCLHLNIWTPFGVANTTISTTSQGTGYNKTPGNNANNSASKRAVLVWIFGGGFTSGTPTLSLYEGGALASEEDIIVVSINYRVSALGFLYFGRPDAPGNAGLFDQLLALQWINDNIEQFGGDPERVTIFGESAGAVSVAYHLLSPLSRNLFSQAILQSGAATCPWGLMEVRDIVTNGLQLAASLNCPSNQSDMDGVMECLRKADPMALVSQEVGQARSLLNFPFVPIVDGSFLLETPAESLAKSNFKQARILLGSNNDEGGSWLIYMAEFSHCPSANSTDGNDQQSNTYPTTQSPSTRPSITPPSLSSKTSSFNTVEIPESRGEQNPPSLDVESFDSIQPLRLAAADYQQQQTLSTKQLEADLLSSQSKNHTLQRSSAANQKQQQQLEYLQNESKPCKPNENLTLSRDEFLKVLGEDINPYAEHPIGKKAIVFEYSNWNNPLDPVSNYDGLDKIVGDYFFTCHVNELAHRYAQAGNAVYMYYFKQRSSQSPWPKWMGVIHADEINFVFGEPLNQSFNYTQKEIDLSKRMMKYWANFAKYGNPTKNGENSTMLEKWPEYADKRSYFELHSDYMRVGRGPRSKQCAFWSQYLPQLLQSYDKNNQCRITGDLSRIHPFPGSAYQLGHFKTKENHSLLTRIPSFLLFSFIVILIISAIAGSFAIISKHTSWKINLWPINRGSNSSPSSPDNEDDGSASRTGHNNSSNA